SINLVPFIDLLSCCISFLLITAVWDNLSQLDVAQQGRGGGEPTEPQGTLTGLVTPGAHAFSTSAGETATAHPRGPGDDDTRLADVMAEARRAHPEREEVVLHAADPVRYDDVIRTIDVLKARFPRVSVSEQGI